MQKKSGSGLTNILFRLWSPEHEVRRVGIPWGSRTRINATVVRSLPARREYKSRRPLRQALGYRHEGTPGGGGRGRSCACLWHRVFPNEPVENVHVRTCLCIGLCVVLASTVVAFPSGIDFRAAFGTDVFLRGETATNGDIRYRKNEAVHWVHALASALPLRRLGDFGGHTSSWRLISA